MSTSLQDSITNLKKLKFLFVEDEKDLLDIIAETLEKLEINFLTASNGEEGLSILKDNGDIDIVITDISMPIMNGIEMIKEINKTHPDMNIVVMTAHTESKYINEVNELGVKDYLLKPFDFIKFIELISDKKIK